MEILSCKAGPSPTLSTDDKPRAECACRLCRGAKEEDRRSMGDLGGNVGTLPFFVCHQTKMDILSCEAGPSPPFSTGGFRGNVDTLPFFLRHQTKVDILSCEAGPSPPFSTGGFRGNVDTLPFFLRHQPKKKKG